MCRETGQETEHQRIHYISKYYFVSVRAEELCGIAVCVVLINDIHDRIYVLNDYVWLIVVA